MAPNSLSQWPLRAWPTLFLISAGSLALVLLLLSVQGTQAEEPELVPTAPGSISGVVTDAAGVPQGNITITLYQKLPYEATNWYPVRSVETDASGVYRIGLLSAGIYRVGFGGSNSRFALNYYNGAATVQEGQDVVIAGNNVTGVNATLAIGAQIAGEIRFINQGGNSLLPTYSDIRALRKVNGRWLLVRSTQLPYQAPYLYNLNGLPAGVYRVCILQYPYYLLGYGQTYAECYDNIGSGIDNAADITVAVGETKPNINFVLGDEADLAQITGTVTGQDGAPLANVKVTALLSQTTAFNSYWNYVSITRTNAAGAYRLLGLQPGLYTVLFDDEQGNYVVEVHDNLPIVSEPYNFANATTFLLQRYEVRANLNATLTPANHLVGSITLRDEGPPLNGEVQVLQEQNGAWQLIRNRSANPLNGAFHIGGLGAGIYKVTAYANALYSYPYAGYYGGKNLDEATPITLTVNQTRTAINIELTRITSGTIFAGEISGIVTATNGPLQNIQVTVYQAGYCCPTPSPLVYAFTAADGRYRINGLVDGQYYVRFSDPSGTYATIWYNNQHALGLLPETVIIGGSTVTNVNASLVRGGGISGNVRLRDGTPLIDIQVQVFQYTGSYYQQPFLEGTVTDANGNYILSGLHPGVYQLCFVDLSYKYAQICYGATPGLGYPGYGIDLVVEAGKTLTGIDQVLGPQIIYYLPIIGR